MNLMAYRASFLVLVIWPSASSPSNGTHDIQEKLASFQDAFDDVVKYFGENPKTTPPSVFFPVFVRFVKAYKVSTGALGSFPLYFPIRCPPQDMFAPKSSAPTLALGTGSG